MAIVLNWVKPLEDSLLQMLSKTDLNYSDIEKIRGIAALLDGALTTDDVERRLAEHVERVEQRYQSTLQRLEQAQTISGVEAVIRDLQEIGDYKEAKQKIEAANQRIQALKQQEAEAEALKAKGKRKRKLIIAAAVAALIVGLAVYSIIARNNVLKTIANARAQAEAGHTEEAAQVIFDLAKAGKQGSRYETLYELSEVVLERTAADQGYEAAFALYDNLLETASGAIRRDDFWSHAQGELVGGKVPGVERWGLLTLMRARQEGESIEGVDAATEQTVLNDCITALCDEMASGSDRDMAGWIGAQREGFDAIRMDPGTAVRLVYALNDAGYDAAELFPDGINVDIPMASRVGWQRNTLLDDTLESGNPNMTALLPVSVVESDIAQSEGSSKLLFEVVCSGEEDLKTRISKAQSDNGHYTVRLLPEYLFRIPEEIRAATYADCTALVCMQNTYIASGTATTVTEYTMGYVPTSTSREYRNCFAAMDLVSVFDLSNVYSCATLYAYSNSARVENQTWFNLHNKDKDLYSRENMLGVFNSQTLKQKYDQTIEELLFYSILMRANDDSQSNTEVDGNDAD